MLRKSDYSILINRQSSFDRSTLNTPDRRGTEAEIKTLLIMASEWESNSEIQRFREYLRIKTVHPDVNYGEYLLNLKSQE